MNFYRDSIKSKGLRITPARIAVLQVLEEAQKPMDIAEILTAVEKNIEADQATIYRITENFVTHDLIKRLQFQEMKFYYEAKRYDHHHAICSKCGSIQDISTCSLDRVEREIARTHGFAVKSHSLEFFGICAQCQEKIF